jgi:predicted GIY-YIG superfamily endonuclease
MPTDPADGPFQLYEDPSDLITSYSYPQPGYLYQQHADVPNYWIAVRELTTEEIEAVETEAARERRLRRALQEEQETARRAAKEAADARPTALYRLRDNQGDLLYVGISSAPPQRWAKHAIDKKWWPEVADLSLEWFDTRTKALDAEARAIKVEQPRHNIQHNRKDAQ